MRWICAKKTEEKLFLQLVPKFFGLQISLFKKMIVHSEEAKKISWKFKEQGDNTRVNLTEINEVECQKSVWSKSCKIQIEKGLIARQCRHSAMFEPSKGSFYDTFEIKYKDFNAFELCLLKSWARKWSVYSIVNRPAKKNFLVKF